MKKTVLVLMLGMLLIAGNLYAADGDLYVNGNVGIGTEYPTAKLDVQATNTQGLKVTVNKDDTGPRWLEAAKIHLIVDHYNLGGIALSARAIHQGIPEYGYGSISGGNMSTELQGAGHIRYGVVGMGNQIVFQTEAGDYNIDKAIGNLVTIGGGWENFGDHNITNYTGFSSGGSAAPKKAGKHSFSGTDWRHAHFQNWGFGADQLGTLTNATGLWIDKQTIATNNRGIVLNGDGAGADIVFGPDQKTRIYSLSEELWVEDGAGNKTQISPHDPETGEWIYYSKNVKTGKVKRVNMEKLVSLVEKLTGETLMVETIEEIK